MKTRFSGSHDISHCNNAACSNKDECRRYQAHLDAIERKLDYLSYFIMEEKDMPDCTAFWPVSNTDKQRKT